MLNRAWFKTAQDQELYAHHLSRCPSYALSNTVITGPFRKNDLFRLKAKFAAEVRRNLFDAYLRPHQTLINLISVSASSSAALPGGEAFRFSFSPNGRTIVALSSSRIYVIDATTDSITIRNELKTLRRPLAASITDDGTTLAVLSSKHQANVYDLAPEGVKHVQVLVMDNPPRTIALAPEGTVLAAAYEGGVEVFSLAPTALSTDRRAVRSEGVDSLNFSGDGSMLVGSTQSLEEPSAVVITAPFYTENDLPPKEVHSRMWTTQILFPQISSVCSHAELLQGHTEGDASWLFAYDHALMSYRAVRTDDTRTGVAYFLNPAANRRFSMPAPTTAPTATMCGTLVVAGFSGSGLWIYGVPEKLDVSPDMGSVVERHEKRLRGGVALTSATGHLEPLMAYSPSLSVSSEEIEDDSVAAKVDWRESLFVKCQQIKSLQSCTAAKWVERDEHKDCAFPGKRLIVVAPGGVDHFVEELGDETMPVDGSRVSILDFDYSPSSRLDREITIEVGEKEPELLTEQIGDMDIEVAMERRRSVRDSRRGGARVPLPLGRSVSTASAMSGVQWGQRRNTASQSSSPLDVDAQMDWANSPPRIYQQPQAILQRSATAAGFTTARYPPRPPLPSQQQGIGNAGHHGSPTQPWPPGDGWQSPPPPYSNAGHGQIQPGMPLGTPFVQPRPGPGQGPVAMPLAGIPENGYMNHQGHMHEVQQSFGGGYVQPMNHHPAPFPPQGAHMLHQAIPGIPDIASSGQYGPPLARSAFGNGQVLPPMSGSDHLQQVAQNSQVSPINLSPAPMTPGHSSSNPASPADPHSPHDTVAPFDHPQAAQLPFRAKPASQQVQKPSVANYTTLTGANLQARLNHPVAPAPTTLEQSRQSQLQGRKQPAPPDTPSPPPVSQSSPSNPAPDSYTVGLPTADLMANLNRRISVTARKPVPSHTTNGAVYQNRTGTATHDFNGDSTVSPSPLRGAWGAAGVTGTSSFNKLMALPNGRSRKNSNSSERSIPISASTPNLHSATPVYPQRPQMGRLDTIDSVSTSYAPGESVSRSHSAGQVDMPSVFQHGHDPLQHLHGQHSLQQQFQPQYQMSMWQGNANANFGPTGLGNGDLSANNTSPLQRRKTKRGKRHKGAVQGARWQTPTPLTNPNAPATGKKEKSRCEVM